MTPYLLALGEVETAGPVGQAAKAARIGLDFMIRRPHPD